MAANFKAPVSGNTGRAPHDLPLPGPKSDLKPTTGKTPVPKRTVVPAAKKGVSLNPAQQANLNVNRLLSPAYQQAQAEAARQNQAIQAYTTAVMQQLSGIPNSIQGDYQHAADTQSGLVNAAAQSLKAANPNADVQGLLNAIGAPAAQGQQIAGQLGNVFTGGAGVSQYTNSLPIAALQEHGLAATELARLQPGNVALAGRQSLLSALKQQGDTRAQIASQYPKLYQDQLNTFASNGFKRQQLALEAQAAGLKQQDTAFKQNLSVAKLKQQQNEFIAKQAAKTASDQKPNNSLSRSAGYIVDSNGNPILVNGKRQILPGFSVNGQGRVIKTPKAGKGAAAVVFPSLTKTQVQNLRGGIARAFRGFYDPKYKDPKTGKIGKKYPALPYWGAVNEAVNHGFSKADAIRMANRFYMPGQRGRPGKVQKSNAQARKGKDATGLGIIVPPVNG